MDANSNSNASAKISQRAPTTIDTSIELANIVLAVVKEVGEMLNHVPYVKSLSGVILQIIKVRDEIKANKQRCREIIDKVLRMSKSIYEKLAEVAQSNQREKLNRLEDQLKEHTRALAAVYDALEKHRTSRSGFSRIINRGLEELNEHDRRLDELNTQLILDIIFRITMQQVGSGLISNPQASIEIPGPSSITDHILPPKPYLMVEREAQFDTTLRVLLGTEPSRVAILGGAGFGKTTLARAILHDPKIAERYKSRYFLSCEGTSGVDAFLLGIGNMLNIKATPSNILASIRRTLQTSTTLLCLDNFETPWESPATRTITEDILASIADIPHLSLIITIRGTQRPSKVAWSHPHLPPLPTLSLDSARIILQNICPEHVVDDFTQKLLEVVDGIPLAITLISNLLRDGESSRELWTRWSKEQTAIIENGGEGRESNLNASIALSVHSPRMTRNPDCLTLLAALSLLPEGFPYAEIEGLEKRLGITGIRKLLQTLRAVALIKPEDTTAPSPRIQMLSPIRLFCHQFLSSKIPLVLEQLCKYYISLMRFGDGGESNPDIYAQIAPEIQNIHSIFQKAYKDGCQLDMGMFIYVTSTLTEWSQYLGYVNKDTIQMALERSSNHPLQRAHCLLSLGSLYQMGAHYREAEKCYREGAELFKQNNATAGEAQALQELGSVLDYMSHPDQAEVAFKASLALYTQLNHKHGQTALRLCLKQLRISNQQYSEIEANTTSILEDFRQAGDLVGIANAARVLAIVYNDLDDLDKSEEFASEALAAAKRANYARGEGGALYCLGLIYLRTDRVMDARRALEQALSISKHQNTFVARLSYINALGDVYIRLDELSAAEALLTASAEVELDRTHNILTTLGWVYTCADRFDKADPILNKALVLSKRFANKAEQANIIVHLGIVYFRSNRLDDAERMLKSTANLEDLPYMNYVEMRRLWTLGDIHIVKGQLEDAEAILDEAMAYAKRYQTSYQQGNILRSMGTLQIERGHVDLAIDKFQEALEFHRRAQWVSEQATDHKRLGEAYEMLGRLEDAAAAFKTADDLMEGVREIRKLAL